MIRIIDKLSSILEYKKHGIYKKTLQEVAEYHNVTRQAVLNSRHKNQKADVLDKLMAYEMAIEEVKKMKRNCEESNSYYLKNDKMRILSALDKIMKGKSDYEIHMNENTDYEIIIGEKNE